MRSPATRWRPTGECGCELAHDRRACTSEVVVLLLIVLCPCCAQTPDLLTPIRFAARRLLGQGYAAGEARSIFGRSDDYRFSRSGRAFTTEAQAEGAIEGDALDYRVASPFATDWRFSRFSAVVAAPRSASKIVSEHDRPLPRDVSQMNFQGADIGSVPVHKAPSPSACRLACLKNPRCEAFTFITRPGKSTRPCWLKGAGYSRNARPSNGATVSGIVRRYSSKIQSPALTLL